MRKDILRLLLLLFTGVNLSNITFAQCDIATNGLSLSASPINVGSTSNFTFSVYNGGSDEACIYAVGAIKVELIFPASGYVFDSFISPVGATTATGPYFAWTYDATNHKVVGINTVAIPYNQGEVNVTVAVKGTAASTGQTTLQLTALSGSNTTTLNDAAPATLTVQGVALPLSIISFTGKSTQYGNDLLWKTSSESNFSHFVVERSSNAANFQEIVAITGGQEKYSYLDITAKETANYYRLVMVDKDGTSTTSKVIFIKSTYNNLSFVGEIYPNPAVNTNVNLNINASNASLWTFTAFDSQGKMLNTTIESLLSGLNKINLEIPKNSNGIIYYKIHSIDSDYVRKVIIP